MPERRPVMTYDPIITAFLEMIGLDVKNLQKATIVINGRDVVRIEATHIAMLEHGVTTLAEGLDGTKLKGVQLNRKFILVEQE